MNEMIERVAKAIFEATMAMHAPSSWDKCNEGQRENVRREARAAIEAMREPTGAMIAAAYVADEKSEEMFPASEHSDAKSASALEHWQAMVDEALK